MAFELVEQLAVLVIVVAIIDSICGVITLVLNVVGLSNSGSGENIIS